MKKLLFLILVIANTIITACSTEDFLIDPQGIQSFYYTINMQNESKTDVHMFVSSEGEAFGEGNIVKPQEYRVYKKLIEKPYEHDFTVSVGRNGVVMCTKNLKLTYSDYHGIVLLDDTTILEVAMKILKENNLN